MNGRDFNAIALTSATAFTRYLWSKECASSAARFIEMMNRLGCRVRRGVIANGGNVLLRSVLAADKALRATASDSASR